jgi:hypothetical protein
VTRLGFSNPEFLAVGAAVLIVAGAALFAVFVAAMVWLWRRNTPPSGDETVRLPIRSEGERARAPGDSRPRAAADAPPSPPDHLKAVIPLDGRRLSLDERVAGRSLPPGPGLDS